MATPAEILREMIDNVESQSENLQSNIDQIGQQIDDLNEQIDGVQNGLCGVAESDLTGYLDGTKLVELEILYGDPTSIPFTVNYGPEYGTINYTTGGITDFEVIDSSGNVEYEYLGTHWDGDLVITNLITDYAFGNDYLTRPLIPIGATYGLIASRNNLTVAKGILINNKNKIDQSEITFEDYAS